MKYTMVALDRDGDVWARVDNFEAWLCLSNADKGSVTSAELRSELGPVIVMMHASVAGFLS